MDWVSAIYALAGTVAGGAIAIVGQGLSDTRKTKAEEASELRSAQREARARERAAIITAMEYIGGSIADIRARSSQAMETLNNIDLAVADDQFSRDVRMAHDASMGAISVVSTSAVRQAALDVFEAWGTYFSQAGEALANGVDADEEIFQRCFSAYDDFFAKARSRLDELDKEDREGMG